MREFIITSKTFTGAITFGYNHEGKLVKFLFEAIMGDEQAEWVRDHLPWNIDEVQGYKSKTTTVTEVTDVSFDRFWKDYDYKKAKDEAIKEWNKLSAADQTKAIVRIPAYKYDCNSRTIAPLYACRYLKHKRFNDE